MKTASPSPFLDAELIWQPLACVRPPPQLRSWLAERGSLTRRLQSYGQFSVEPLYQRITRPTAVEAMLLGLPMGRWALIREVLLRVDGQPVVFARSVLPLRSISGANRVLGHLARRSLGAELFKLPRATRRAVWAAPVPPSRLPEPVGEPCWGRQSLFIKRAKPLLVAEVFLPGLPRQA
ncbi:MAG: chorismate lyase [Alcanivoracaceae bacterium]|nr:chorismate lyase [Alcanivoracaceae bacterium]